MTKIYSMDEILAKFDYAGIDELLKSLTNLKYLTELELNRICARYYGHNVDEDEDEDWDDEEYTEEEFMTDVEVLEEELFAIDTNIRVLRDSLVIYENKVNTFMLIDEVQCRICLN